MLLLTLPTAFSRPNDRPSQVFERHAHCMLNPRFTYTKEVHRDHRISSPLAGEWKSRCGAVGSIRLPRQRGEVYGNTIIIEGPDGSLQGPFNVLL
jgi:hypothetical protein